MAPLTHSDIAPVLPHIRTTSLHLGSYSDMPPPLPPHFRLAQAIFEPNLFRCKLFFLLTLPIKMGQTGCSKTSAYKIQMLGSHPRCKYDRQEFNLPWIWCTEYPQSQVPVLRIYHMLTKPVWNIQSFENCSFNEEICALQSTSTWEPLVALIISNQWATCANDEAIFHMFGHVNRHNFRMRGIENQQYTREHIPVSLKLNIWCGEFISPFSCIRKLSCGVSVST